MLKTHLRPPYRLKLLLLLAGLVLFAFCGRAQGQPPAPGDSWTEPRTGMVFKWVPDGCASMGSPEDEPGRNLDEGPRHEVCLSGFWMGKTEVTAAQWEAVMGSNPSLIKHGDDYPVDMVSWDMAKEFVARLNRLSGGSFRLPTEAEWEYACRAGAQTPYAMGETLSQNEATFDRHFAVPVDPPTPPRRTSRRKGRRIKPRPQPKPGIHTTAAGHFPGNAYGLQDMHGNLWEWCEDVYDAGYYARSPRENPLNEGSGVSRVLRGGSWVTKMEALRSANRGSAWPDLRTAFYGLRLVRQASPAKADTPAPAAPRATAAKPPAPAR